MAAPRWLDSVCAQIACECKDRAWHDQMLPARALDGSLHHPSCSSVPTLEQRRAYAKALREAGRVEKK